jgi:FkbM family methyltransferase
MTSANYRKFIFFSLRYGSKKRFVARTIRFNKLKIYTPDTLSFIWQYKEIFADESYKFQSDSRNPIIYDCGANIGVSCLYFSRNYPTSTIKAFEADPNIAKILRENLSNNNVKNVEIIDKTVWINSDGVEISLEGADGASIYSKNNVIKVPSTRLRDLIENEKKIDMLKIDIEGAEHDVLLDCKDSLNKVENIFIEYHSFANSNQNLSDILSILEKNHFRYFIKPVTDRAIPFVNRINKFNPGMDLQLNIYAYKNLI